MIYLKIRVCMLVYFILVGWRLVIEFGVCDFFVEWVWFVLVGGNSSEEVVLCQ